MYNLWDLPAPKQMESIFGLSFQILSDSRHVENQPFVSPAGHMIYLKLSLKVWPSLSDCAAQQLATSLCILSCLIAQFEACLAALRAKGLLSLLSWKVQFAFLVIHNLHRLVCQPKTNCYHAELQAILKAFLICTLQSTRAGHCIQLLL